MGRNTHHQEGCSIVGGDPNWCITGDPVNPIANRITAGLRRHSVSLPGRDDHRPEHQCRTRSCNNLGDKTTIWDGTRVQAAPTFAWGNRVANAPPNNNSPFSNFILDTVSSNAQHHADEGERAATRSRPATTTSTASRSAARATSSGRSTSTTTRTTRSTPGSASPTPRSASSARTRSCRAGVKAPTRRSTTRLRPGQLEGDPPADARLRRAVRPPGAELRRLPDGLELLPRSVDEARTRRGSTSTAATPASIRAPAANRRAMDPVTGQFVGTVGAGQHHRRHAGAEHRATPTNGLHSRRHRASPRPASRIRPWATRRGSARAWDVKGDQTVRRPRRRRACSSIGRRCNSIYGTVSNPPFSQNVTVRYGNLQDIGSAGLHDGRAAVAHRVRVRQRAADVVPVEHRRADGDAVRRAPSTCRTPASTATTPRTP